MSSIVPGYEYDIFISYRQNDNRSGWVTEFVHHLNEELASTIKEPISVYFDANPHDGLLETHNVDKSLEGKLKCLVFIPILSQTYCDPKSFAWQHEFCAFNKLANGDLFGRDIRLNNGNVASRILPVKIHELDSEDKAIIENQIGDPLRAIDFIYSEPGVNRPLKISDDRTTNQSKTDYKNQINKTANAIKDIIASLRSLSTNEGSIRKPSIRYESKRPSGKIRNALTTAVIFVLILAGYYILFQKDFLKSSANNETDKSVAVLAFDDLSPQHDQEWFSDGLTEEILNSLANLQDLKVAARTSSFYFKGKDVPLSDISHKLGVAHIVEGSVQKIDNRLRITVQLIRASDGFHIWSQKYERNYEDLFKVQTEIAENIAQRLVRDLTPEKKEQLTTTRPSNLEAYENYLKGYKIHYDKYIHNHIDSDFKNAERYLLKAISLDPSYAEAYGQLANLYDSKSNLPMYQEEFRRARDSIVRIGFRLNPRSVETLLAYGYSFARRDERNMDSAFFFFKKAFQIAPENPRTNYNLSWFYSSIGLPELAVRFGHRAIEIDPLGSRGYSLVAFGNFGKGEYDSAKKYFTKSLNLSEDISVHAFAGYLAIMHHDLRSARQHLDRIEKINSTKSYEWVSLYSLILVSEGKTTDPLKLKRNNYFYGTVLSILKMKQEIIARLDSTSQASYNSLNPSGLKYNPYYDFVRNDPQFKIISERVQKNFDKKMMKYGKLN